MYNHATKFNVEQQWFSVILVHNILAITDAPQPGSRRAIVVAAKITYRIA
jgi:hypothetical protein